MLRRILSAVSFLAGLFGAAEPTRAQGCVLCYTSALAAGKGVQDALRNGVLVLLVPVALLLIAVVVLVWRRASPATNS
jgi:hypothetical protein